VTSNTFSLIAIALACSISSSHAQQATPSATEPAVARPAGIYDTLLEASPRNLPIVNGEWVDRLRTAQLTHGVAVGPSLLLRSASSLAAPLPGAHLRLVGTFIEPQLLLVNNTALPFSLNNGSMWAGKGVSTKTSAGFRVEAPHLRLIVAPELVVSANSNWPLFQDYYIPELPPGRSKFDLPFYAGPFTIDHPMRYGDRPIRRLSPGQSTLALTTDRIALGVSTENDWWGPGIRNAIMLSNNAPGFTHLFLGTRRPVATRFGDIEARWIVGGLVESAYFDTDSTNNLRSIAAAVVTIQTAWDPNLSFGAGRTVYGTASGWNQALTRWFDIFARTSRTDSHPEDTTAVRRDHFYSLFGRWVFPDDGVEVYAEWARLLFPRGIKDLMVAPNHTQGYTIGLQWRGGQWAHGSFRAQAELTQLEQSATFRDRPSGSWYFSRRVIQGYTNNGETIGASIGPGASSQWISMDFLRSSGRIGIYGGRIRWNEDVHSNYGFPVYVAYCSHDVSLYPGVRAAKSGWFGTFTADLSLQNRENVFFQNGGGCPNNGKRLDIRNKTLTLTFAPLAF
jgi:hypothetical protein